MVLGLASSCCWNILVRRACGSSWVCSNSSLGLLGALRPPRSAAGSSLLPLRLLTQRVRAATG